jgi:uncharacterized membrane protein YgdD (TMEM256/DUF423 family)
MVADQRMRHYAVPAMVGIAGASAVLLGAWGAHGLRAVVDAQAVAIWRTAVRFQFWHALALGVLTLAAHRGVSRAVAAWAFGIGIVLFCGSLYALALGAPRTVGLVTPIGGIAFVVGWIALALGLARSARDVHRA